MISSRADAEKSQRENSSLTSTVHKDTVCCAKNNLTTARLLLNTFYFNIVTGIENKNVLIVLMRNSLAHNPLVKPQLVVLCGLNKNICIFYFQGNKLHLNFFLCGTTFLLYFHCENICQLTIETNLPACMGSDYSCNYKNSL